MLAPMRRRGRPARTVAARYRQLLVAESLEERLVDGHDVGRPGCSSQQDNLSPKCAAERREASLLRKALTLTISPDTGPAVAGDHGAASAITLAVSGSRSRTHTLRVRQPVPNSPQLSLRTLRLPPWRRRSSAHAVAFSRFGEPVRREPIPSTNSDAYSTTRDRDRPSSLIWPYMTRSGSSLGPCARRTRGAASITPASASHPHRHCARDMAQRVAPDHLDGVEAARSTPRLRTLERSIH